MIRQAQKEDVSRIAEIVVFSKRMAYRPIFLDDDYLFSVLNVKAAEADYLKEISRLLVYDDGLIKGVLKYQMAADDLWEVSELYVDYFFQHSGVGQKLLQEVLQMAGLKNVRHVGLWVVERNQKAIDFYLKSGFVKTKLRQLIDGTNQYEIYMTLKL